MTKQHIPKDFNEVLDRINVLKQDKGMTWMDAILEYCETDDVRIEEVGYLIKEQPSFLKIIEKDFKDNNFIKSTKKTSIVNLLSEWM